MIRTDRNYNERRAAERQARIERLELEMDELAERMFDDPSLCVTENIRRLNYLSSQIAIMRGEPIPDMVTDPREWR